MFRTQLSAVPVWLALAAGVALTAGCSSTKEDRTANWSPNRIYAEAFGRNPEFYSFYRSLEAYRESFRNKDGVLVLDPNSEFFKYFGEGASR